MDVNTIKFRASKIGALMTTPRDKSENIAETTKTYLTEVYINKRFGIEKEIESKYITKGLMVEEDSITLYSKFTRSIYFKNEERIENEYITGTPDLYEGESLKTATIIHDVKSSWDIFTFFGTNGKKLNKDYYWQMQSYMALTGATTSFLGYCLIDTPETIINDEKRKLQWKMAVIDDLNPDYVKACELMDARMKYDNIPLEERVIRIEIKRNEEDIQAIYDKVKLCREYLKENYKWE